MPTDAAVARWILTAVFGGVAVSVIAFNYACIVRHLLGHERVPSLAPIGGAIAGAFALFFVPIENAWRFAWVPAVIDPGSVFLLVSVPIYLLVVKLRRR